MEPFKSITLIQDIGFESQAIFVPDHFFLVGPGQDMYGGPGTERNYVSICFGSKGTRQKLKISHLSANSCMFFQNIQLSIVFLRLHPVHLYFQGLLG